MQEGPTVITKPASIRNECIGCTHLKKEPGTRGRFEVTDTYLCVHPATKEYSSSIFGRGRCIEYMAKQTPATPSWCPVIANQYSHIKQH